MLFLTENSNVISQDLVKHCKTYLPLYAVPSNISVMKSFPRTGSGKVNRKEIEKKLEAL